MVAQDGDLLGGRTSQTRAVSWADAVQIRLPSCSVVVQTNSKTRGVGTNPTTYLELVRSICRLS